MRSWALIVSVFLVLMPFPARGQESAVSFSIVRDKIVFPVSVNGAGPYPFVLDLGITHPVLSRSTADALSLSATSKDQVIAPVVEVRELRLGEAASRPIQALVMDLASFKTTLGAEVAGILSPREIGEELHIDFAANTLSVQPHSEDGSIRTDARSVRLRFDENNQPAVSAILNGKHVRSFIVDTTFGGTLGMPEQALRDLGLVADATPCLAVEGLPAGGSDSLTQSEKMQVRIESVRVGSAEIQGPVCTVLSSEEAPRIGIGFLRNFRAVFDFEGRLLRLEHTGALPIVAGPVIGCGLTPARINEGYWTMWIAKDSPAAKAGIRSGETLIDVNGRDLKDASYASVTQTLEAEEGETLSVTLVHEGERRMIAVTARRLL
jgi:hypothetical protein